jgi:hypothetical protein
VDVNQDVEGDQVGRAALGQELLEHVQRQLALAGEESTGGRERGAGVGMTARPGRQAQLYAKPQLRLRKAMPGVWPPAGLLANATCPPALLP